jgi:hypothetical protein
MTIIDHFIKMHSLFRYAHFCQPVENLKQAVNLVTRYSIKSEIIGEWLYCYTTALIGCQLECIGFWYSYKHHAYVFTGGQRFGFADFESLDEIRYRLGSYTVI